jgi:hypothetical protein
MQRFSSVQDMEQHLARIHRITIRDIHELWPSLEEYLSEYASWWEEKGV